MAAGFVYFATDNGARVKIGKTAGDWRRRERALQTGNPDLRVVAVRELPTGEDATRCESNLHRRFAAFHLAGEWFRLAPELADYMGRYATETLDRLEPTGDPLRMSQCRLV